LVYITDSTTAVKALNAKVSNYLRHFNFDNSMFAG